MTSILDRSDIQRSIDREVTGPQYFSVVTLTADLTVPLAAHNAWYDCDTDTAGGDITITIPTGLPEGTIVHFSKAGTGGDVVLVAGGGMTLRNSGSITTENAAASALILTTSTALIVGTVS